MPYSLKHLSLLLILLWMSGCSIMQTNPSGTDYQSRPYHISEKDISFLYDLTYRDAEYKIIRQQVIFDSMFSIIKKARKHVLLDMFLFNSYRGKESGFFRDISEELADSLIAKKKKYPDITIDFITDPVNNVYFGDINPHVERMREAGINVIYTDLTKLKDSNFFYSPIWRIFFQWFGNSTKHGIMPHPFATGKKVTARSYLTLLNFKANHRKVLLADQGNTYAALVTSANPHSGSSSHSNTAVLLTGPFAKEIYLTEKAVAKFSGDSISDINFSFNEKPADAQDTQISLITEKRIFENLYGEIENSCAGDSISVGVFYLSERKIIKSLIKASLRGVVVRIILDPNKDAFGHQKNGIPNRPVAKELRKKSKNGIKIRWYDTHGEQFHSKFVLIARKQKPSTIILGSANYTRRNIKNYNLETNVMLKTGADSKLFRQMSAYFSDLWYNKKHVYTVNYANYGSSGFLKYWIYRIQEKTGMGTF